MSINVDRRQFWITVGLIFAAILLAPLVRLATVGPVEDKTIMLTRKIEWPPEYNLLIVGDSRVNLGINPEQFEEGFPGTRAGNFGFGNLAYSRRVLELAESKLDPAKPRTLILGVSPGMLSDKAMGANSFIVADSRAKSLGTGRTRQLKTTFQEASRFFAPAAPDALIRKLIDRPKTAVTFTTVEHTNGWTETDRQPRDTQAAMNGMDQTSILAPANPEHLQVLLDQIKQLRSKGISVYAFWPPEDPVVRRRAEESTGWTESEWSQKFTEAGATWLSAPCDKYETYDGIHLPPEQARKLSSDLIKQIQSFSEGA